MTKSDRTYSAPKLTQIGSVSKLTAGMMPGSLVDLGANMTVATMIMPGMVN